jgi:hypothetical protein
MPPKIFTWQKDKFTKVKTSLDSLYGWWQTIAIKDLDGDGKNDLILGNAGDNFYLRPDKSSPVKLWVNDFDKNGVIDKILTYTIEGKDKPVFLKRDLEEAMPFLKKKNLKHADYAMKSIQDILPAEELNKAVVKQFTYSSTCIALNKGNGQFTIRKLPPVVQFSSVNAIDCEDINNDGYPDIVLGGNEFTFKPQLERLDANSGIILLNDGKGNFKPVEPSQTGLNLRGQLRDIQKIHAGTGDYLLFLQNDEYPLLFRVNKQYNQRDN